MSRRSGISDTSPDAMRVLIDCYRRMPLERKWRIMGDAYRTARTLHEIGFRARHFSSSSHAIQSEWRKLALGSAWRPQFDEDSAVDASLLDNLPVLCKVISVFQDLAIPCALGGSWASSIQGVPRQTQDADLTALPFPGRERDLIERLGGDFYISETAIREANQRRSGFNIIHTHSGFKVDVFIRRDTPYAVAAFNRRQSQAFPGTGESVDVISPEDIIIHKLEGYRIGGEKSERQWEDVLGVLRVQGDRLDNAYLDHWASELNVADLLAEARADAVI
jgi:hypothetical protein